MRTKYKEAGKNMLYDAMVSRTRINIPSRMEEMIDALTLDGFDFASLDSISDFSDGLHSSEYSDPGFDHYVGESDEAQDEDILNIQPLDLSRWIKPKKWRNKNVLRIKLDHNLIVQMWVGYYYVRQHMDSRMASVQVHYTDNDWAIASYQPKKSEDRQYIILWRGSVSCADMLTKTMALDMIKFLQRYQIQVTNWRAIYQLEYFEFYGKN